MPGGHWRHESNPGVLEYLPGAHATHRVPGTGAKEPGAQGEQAVPPGPAVLLPAPHATHVEGDAKPITVEKKPVGHGKQALRPDALP